MSARPAAFVFDAFGTLFDVGAIALSAEDLLPGHGAALAKLWRAKQLEYTWLTSLMGGHRDFAALTEAALDYALAALVLPLDADARASLAGAWHTLPVYDDVRDGLSTLAGRPRWILSNGTAPMLSSLVQHNALDALIDGALSVDEAGTYKPAPAVYALATARLGLPADAIAFVSSNAWDVAGAKAFGFRTCWIDRAGVPVERHAPPPDAIVGSFAELVARAA